MNFSNTTVGRFLGYRGICYAIPVYQRAYAWGEDNWQYFLSDLLEQLEGKSNYFFGNVLLEVIKKDKEYHIVDGQQRITTLTLFIHALLSVLEENCEKSKDSIQKDSIQEEREDLLGTHGKRRLRPCEYDQDYFDSLLNSPPSESTGSQSQRRMKEAVDFFTAQLNKQKPDVIVKLLDIVKSTGLTTIELPGKRQAALMFELENNRGRPLTALEKLKAYLMYQMYVHCSPSDAEERIEKLSKKFGEIYRIFDRISKKSNLSEDDVVFHHNTAYITGFHKSKDTSPKLGFLKKVFKAEGGGKVAWIEKYVQELQDSFDRIELFRNDIQGDKYKYATYLEHLVIPAYIYPFILKGYKHKEGDNVSDDFFRILEIIVFRVHLVNSKAKIQDKLHDVLLSYTGDIDAFKKRVKDTLNSPSYWGNEKIEKCLNGEIYGNKALRYLLTRYEEHLSTKGYESKAIAPQIEHISPKTTPGGNDTPSSGYEVDENNQYKQDFIESSLHSLGNLTLISKSHNASIGNKPFAEKLASYKESPLQQHKEIKTFADKDGSSRTWRSGAIEKRKKKIVKFALATWRDWDF